MKSFLNLVGVLLFVIALNACSRQSVFSEYKSIPIETGWQQANKLTFEVNIEDTITRNNVFVNVRQLDAYPFRNIFLFLTTEYPDGKKIIDTLECVLADEKNKWMGDGAGDLWDNTIPFKGNVKFPLLGKYKFTYEHAMRVDPLPMIIDMGLTIEKTSK